MKIKFLDGSKREVEIAPGANLTDAILTSAYLTDADLRDADLRGARLVDADLTGAILTGADLTGADLTGAILTGAYLTDAILPHFQICPEKGCFRAFKKVETAAGEAVIEIEIAASAQRTSSLVGRKCRANKVRVVSGLTAEAWSTYDHDFKYPIKGEVLVVDFDDDIRVECARGIHFFITRREAEEY